MRCRILAQQRLLPFFHDIPFTSAVLRSACQTVERLNGSTAMAAPYGRRSKTLEGLRAWIRPNLVLSTVPVASFRRPQEQTKRIVFRPTNRIPQRVNLTRPGWVLPVTLHAQ